MTEAFIDISGVPERFIEPLKMLVEVLREIAREREKERSGTKREAPKEISLEGLSEDEKEFILILVEFFRERMKKKPEKNNFIKPTPLGVKGNVSREEIYDYLDDRFPPIHNGKNEKEDNA